MELYVSVDNQGWETAKVLVFDLAEAGEPVQFFEPSGNGATTCQDMPRSAPTIN